MRRLREAIRLKIPELWAKTNLGFSPKIRRISFRNHRIPVFGFVWLLTIAKTQETTPDKLWKAYRVLVTNVAPSVGIDSKQWTRIVLEKLTFLDKNF